MDGDLTTFVSFHMVRILAGTAALPDYSSRVQALATPAPVERKGSDTRTTANKKRRNRKVSAMLDCTKGVSVDDITFEMVTDVLTT